MSRSRAVCPEAAFDALEAAGVRFWCGVPDSLLGSFCAAVARRAAPRSHVVCANEGAAVGTAAGHFLATGAVPLVYLQNSGLGNAVNPCLSLAHAEVYSVPMVLLVGWRGAPGEKDEPQHVVQGRLTVAMLEAMDVRHWVLPKGDPAAALGTLAEAVEVAGETRRPVAVLVAKGSFAGEKAVAPVPAAGGNLTREAALRVMVESAFAPQDAVVCSTGYASRELYELRTLTGTPRAQDLYMVGSMGHAVAIATGIALAQPERTVWCVDGDGAVIMHMGSLPVAAAAGPPNLLHVVINNGVHDSVGGQPTAASVEGACDFAEIAAGAGYARSERIAASAGPDGLAKALAGMRAGAAGARAPSLLEVGVALGTRADLGRPKTTVAQTREAFMGHLAARQ